MNQIVVKTTAKFQKDIKKLLKNSEIEELYDYLANNPNSGKTVVGTGGVRKLRWSSQVSAKGKSGGLRILYHYSNDILVILLSAYSKSEMENISQAEKNELKKLIPLLTKQIMENL
jgi:mRNA-degrading endonuclease RelE of RelBE toxin-antitoxin system